MSRQYFASKARRLSKSDDAVKDSKSENHGKKQTILSKFFSSNSSSKQIRSTDPATGNIKSCVPKESDAKVLSSFGKRQQSDCSSPEHEQPHKRTKVSDSSTHSIDTTEDLQSSSNAAQTEYGDSQIEKKQETFMSEKTLKKLSLFVSTSVINSASQSLPDKTQPVSLDEVKLRLGTVQDDNSSQDGPSQDSGMFCSSIPSTESDEESEEQKLRGISSFGALSKFSRPSSSTESAKDVRQTARTNIGPSSKIKYTPLEKQVLEIKKRHEDTVLFVECGYKYRFFGEDAQIAAKELSIYCHMDHNFMTASVPVHRLHVHVRRLVSAGYKVGVVKQTETAALKAAGENKSAPFTRQLTALYTKATLIGEDVDPVFSSDGASSAPQSLTSGTCLMTIYEPIPEEFRGRPHNLAIVAVHPSTGDVTYDKFTDGRSRSELEARISHIAPVELLLPRSLSVTTEKVLGQILALSSTADDRIRVERGSDDDFQHTQAVIQLTEFFNAHHDSACQLSEVLSLPQSVICCLSGLLSYLKAFNLQNILKLTSQFERFSLDSGYMRLGARTLQNLEIFHNDTDGKERGSLFWLVDHTATKFGRRKLRAWLARPLLDVDEITSRLDAVQYICQQDCPHLPRMKSLLQRLPDLEKGLATIFHKKCSTGEFLSVCRSLESVYTLTHSQTGTLDDRLLNTTFSELPELLEGVGQWVSAINEKAAKDGDKAQLFTDESRFPAVLQVKQEIASILQELSDHRKEIRLKLRMPVFEFATVSGTEFLIEVKNSNLHVVPADWEKISSTKAVSRFHSPFVVSATKHLAQLRERLQITADQAWKTFLSAFEDSYARYKKAVGHLATLDCLFSLAQLARQDGYVRPTFDTHERCLRIIGGRHPVVSALLGERQQFVPNNTELCSSGQRCMVITGPNMGGKSSYIKQVAVLVILAQIGSFVPARSATLSITDAIYTRMGAADELFRGRSTFMVELQEASDIMAAATERSLVILDELGRGTSTHDGVAIAMATLQYFVDTIRCMTLFVTHYPPLTEMAESYGTSVGNHHMAFMVHDQDDITDCDVVTFLYTLTRGRAESSYGLNVARLAEIPQPILQVAALKSRELQSEVTQRRKQLSEFLRFFRSPEDVIELLKQYRDGVESTDYPREQS